MSPALVETLIIGVALLGIAWVLAIIGDAICYELKKIRKTLERE